MDIFLNRDPFLFLSNVHILIQQSQHSLAIVKRKQYRTIIYTQECRSLTNHSNRTLLLHFEHQFSRYDLLDLGKCNSTIWTYTFDALKLSRNACIKYTSTFQSPISEQRTVQGAPF